LKPIAPTPITNPMMTLTQRCSWRGPRPDC
jgi:hypothetical protein